MSIGIADAVIAKIVERAAEQVAKKATIIVRFTNDIDWLAKKLTTMRDYLQDADGKSIHNELVQKWVHNVRDISWDAEDILEECAVTRMSCVCTYSNIIFRYRMGRRIKHMRARMVRLMKDATELKLVRGLFSFDQPLESSSNNIRQRRTSIVDGDSPTVAIDTKVEQVLALLDEASNAVIAVVGMGGIGKTFLMQHVFNRVKERYENSIWLSISQTYSLRKLQSDLASNIKLAVDVEGRVNQMKAKLKEVVRDGISEIRAAEIIHDCLEGRKTLVVLDDVWRASSQEKLIAELGLPIGDNSRTKIVVTTRSREVCSNMKARAYEMEFLSDEESWELFCFHAFPGQKRPPRYLDEIAREIEKECAKVPFAIKTVAGFLADKTVRKEWEVKLNQLKQVINRNDPIINILKLTYDSLPARLKPCFVYLSFFPEDKQIDCEYLIHLWIAEGFIPHVDDQFEVGWDYLYQLERLYLVNIDHNSVCSIYKTCSVHDLVLDLALYISKENRCSFSVEDFLANDPNRLGCRRILLAKKSIDSNVISSSSVSSPEVLRSLSLSENQIENIPTSFFSRISVLRVLDLSHTNISTMPKCIGNLKLLRVLNLRKTKIEKVPECIRSLKSLCFLDISWCRAVRGLPVWIGELQFLQHLNIWECYPELISVIPKGISKVLSLQTLRSDELILSIEDNGLLKLEHVAALIHLQELRLNLKHEVQLRSIAGGILGQLVNMRILQIVNDSPQSTTMHPPRLPESFTAMRDLEFLDLKKFAIPSWVCEFTNLKTLYLSNVDGSNYADFEMIPNLTRLHLEGNTACRNLPKAFGKPGGFPRLQQLRIFDFPLLHDFPELEDGAMPRLQNLYISDTPIRNAPIGLEHLKSLKLCYLSGVGADVKEELKEGGEYRRRIDATIPHVDIEVRH